MGDEREKTTVWSTRGRGPGEHGGTGPGQRALAGGEGAVSTPCGLITEDGEETGLVGRRPYWSERTLRPGPGSAENHTILGYKCCHGQSGTPYTEEGKCECKNERAV